MVLQGNWVDLVILLILGWFVWDGWQKGVFWLGAQIVAFVGSLLVAFRGYQIVAEWIRQIFNLPYGLDKAIAFLVVGAIVEQIIYEILARIILRIPKKYFPKWWQGFMSLVPSLLSGLVMVAFLANLIMALPLKGGLKKDITNAKIAGWLMRRTQLLERGLNNIFGQARETLTFLTTIGKNENVALGWQVDKSEYRVDEMAETEIFNLINKERVNRGILALNLSAELTQVARSYSQDMAEGGYFAHISPEGKSVGDRLHDAGIKFEQAGENLALAPTVAIIHEGLMNSEGHRANILLTEFTKVGVGVIEVNGYGKMVTQVFTD